MTSIDRQDLSLTFYPTSLVLNLRYKPSFVSLSLCQVLSGRSQRQIYSPEEKVGSGFIPAKLDVCVFTTKPRCGTWGLRPHHQPKQMTWNPTDHNRGRSIANKPITAALSFKQSFSKLSCEVFWAFLWSPHYTSWQIPWDVDAADSANSRPAPA